MKIIIAQLPVDHENPRHNFNRAVDLLKRHQSWAPDIIILPQTFLSGPLGGRSYDSDWLAAFKETWREFLNLSREHSHTLLATSSLNVENGPYNSQETGFIIQNGEVLLVQPKISGSRNAIETRPTLLAHGHRLALLVGRDAFLAHACGGANFIIELFSEFYQGPEPSSPALNHRDQAGAWRCRINTCGGQGSRIFTGGSRLYNPEGFLAIQAPDFEAAEIHFSLDLASSLLTGLRTEPEPLETLRLALVTGLRDYVTRTDCGKVILGLSGGLDSALCAVLAAQALGPDQVRGLTLPSPYSAPESALDAARLARNLGLPFGEAGISDLLKLTLKELNPHLAPDPSGEATGLMAENIQARLRGVLLMALANQDQRLLICTSNKSETAMGYGTLYGDLCGSLAPLGDVYKSRAYDLARHINQSKPLIPERIITRAPSAELKPGQTDQDCLPPYPLLDDILYRLVELKQSAKEVAASSPSKNETGFGETVDFVRRQMSRSAFKALQIPPCLIASPRPFKYE